jgi:hypothetical protein
MWFRKNAWLLLRTTSHTPTAQMGFTRQHKEYLLFFSSTFEPISLTLDSCMQRKGVPMLYKRSATVLPTLYVCPVKNVLDQVPFILCYLNGNTCNTIPHKYRGATPAEAAEDSRPDSGTGSRLFEINIWMWRYGRTFPPEIAVAESVELHKKRLADSRIRSAATIKHRREAKLIARVGNDI